MNRIILIISILIVSCQPGTETTHVETKESPVKAEYAMVIHGGAGTITRDKMTPEKEMAYREKMNEVLRVGEALLQQGEKAENVVVACIGIMENSPLFNAGKGAVFTNAETNELDASIMRGIDQEAGAVSGVTTIKNPIKAAFEVMVNSDHVMLSGSGAEEFAKSRGCELVEPSYFFTDRRMESLQRAKKSMEEGTKVSEDTKHGTVGCVVLDKSGNIAAGTSTGGMTNKKYNRIGDSPVIGAGTYADNATCGVSSTGHGEYFIRYAVAHDISARMAYKGISLKDAAEEVVMQKLVDKGGNGGVVALDNLGNIAMPFNTAGMYRGYVKPGEKYIGIYKEE